MGAHEAKCAWGWCVRFWPELLAGTAAIVFASVIMLERVWLPPTHRYVGFVQCDQPVYYACARELFENGNGLFYANPYSNSPTSPRIYSHLYSVVVGWIWRATGLEFGLIDGGVRLVLGPVMLWLAAAIFRRVHRPRPGANWMLALMLLGGGISSIIAASGALVGTLSDLWISPSRYWPLYLLYSFDAEFRHVELYFGDWHPSLFRNLMYSTEVFYHCLFFTAILALLHRRHFLGTLFVFATWWAHAYTAVALTLIVMVWLLVELRLGDTARWKPLAATTAVFLLFLYYYGVYLPRFPEHKSVFYQMMIVNATMSLSELVCAYGFLLFFTAFMFVPRFFLRSCSRPEMRLAYAWLFVAAVLNFHDRLTLRQFSIQPLHFSHGYLFIPLVLVGFEGVRVLSHLEWPRSARRAAAVLSCLAFFVHLPDNVAWCTMKLLDLRDTRRQFAPPREAYDLLVALDTLPDTETILDVGFRGGEVRELIPALTHHRVVRGHGFNTPFSHKKARLMRTFEHFPRWEPLRESSATAVLVQRAGVPVLREKLGNILGPTLLEQGNYALLRVVPPGHADATATQTREATTAGRLSRTVWATSPEPRETSAGGSFAPAWQR